MESDFGRINPQAPQVLGRFAFLIGRFQCEARLKVVDGGWQVFHADWQGRYILDGFAIADEYAMTDLAGKLIVRGMNFRTYDAAKGVWNIKWLNALTGSWSDLASAETGGVTVTDASISYSFKEPVAAQAYTRATYKDIAADRFTWVGEKSEDGTSWGEFMVVDCRRVAV
jgi:hypothetical protein